MAEITLNSEVAVTEVVQLVAEEVSVWQTASRKLEVILEES
jgi:hypothetical protein